MFGWWMELSMDASAWRSAVAVGSTAIIKRNQNHKLNEALDWFGYTTLNRKGRGRGEGGGVVVGRGGIGLSEVGWEGTTTYT